MCDIRGRLRKYGLDADDIIRLPNVNDVNQLLKLSETDRDRAIRELTSLYSPIVMTTCMFGPKFCSDMVELYLENPYLVYHPLDKHTLTTKEDIERDLRNYRSTHTSGSHS